MKIENNRDSASRVITKFDLQWDRFEPSSPSTKELHGCLVCYKPTAPLHYRDPTYLVKLWYFKEKTRLIKSILYFKRHKCRRSVKSLQKLFKGRKAAKSF